MNTNSYGLTAVLVVSHLPNTASYVTPDLSSELEGEREEDVRRKKIG